MADLQKVSSFFSGPVVKTVLVAGAAGGSYVFVSDFFLARYFKEEGGDTDTENAEYMRAAVQGLGGLALAGILSKYSRDAAIGVGIGAIVGAARHVAIKLDVEASLERQFPEDGTGTGTGTGTGRGNTGLSMVRGY